MRMQNLPGTALAALALAASLVACDSPTDETGTGASGAAAKRAMTPQAAQLAANMVTAVSAGDDKSAVDLKFEVTHRPEVGKPTDISIVFIPVSPLDRVYARFTAVDGLEMVKGEQTEQFARPVVGAAITHTLTVLAKRDGIFSIQATVLMDSERDSVSRSFSIPLIAGSGIAEWSPKKAAARDDDAG